MRHEVLYYIRLNSNRTIRRNGAYIFVYILYNWFSFIHTCAYTGRSDHINNRAITLNITRRDDVVLL